MKRIVIALVFVLAVTGGIIGYAYLSVSSENQKNTNTQPASTKNTSISAETKPDELTQEIYKSNGFSSEDRRTEAFLDTNNYSSNTNKEYIYDRMLNSIDYFDTLQATYNFVSAQGNSQYSTYCIQQGNNPKSKEIIYNENGDWTSFMYFDGTSVNNVSNYDDGLTDNENSILNENATAFADKIIAERNTLTINNILALNKNAYCQKYFADIEADRKLDFVSLVDSKKRIKYIEEEQQNCYFYRHNIPQLSISVKQYFSQDFAFGLLSDFNNWNIDKTENAFGRKCFVITGKIGGDYAEKINTHKFEMWVDMENGILITLKGYDINESPSISLTTYEYKINESINQYVFEG